MGQGASAGGLRVFQPQHTRQQGRRLHHLSRPDRPDAAGLSGQHAAHAVVRRLPQESRAEPPANGQGICDGLETRSRSGGIGPEIHGGTKDSDSGRADQLLDLSPLTDRMSEQPEEDHQDDRPAIGQKLEELSLSPPPLDLTAVRAQLRAKTGKQYWRTLEELSGDPRFEELLHREFPRQAPSEWDEDRKSTRLNSSHVSISYAVFCLKKNRHERVFAESLATILRVGPEHDSPNALDHELQPAVEQLDAPLRLHALARLELVAPAPRVF